MLIVGIVLSSAVVVLLHRKGLFYGLRALGGTLVAGTIFTFVFSLMMRWGVSSETVFNVQSGQVAAETEAAIIAILDPLARVVLGDVADTLMLITGTLGVIGLLLLGSMTLHLQRVERKQS